LLIKQKPNGNGRDQYDTSFFDGSISLGSVFDPKRAIDRKFSEIPGGGLKHLPFKS
jgi:hypothetical protein